jgi:hypothetical protein
MINIRDEQVTNTTTSEEQPAIGRGAMILSLLRYLPGLALIGLAAVLYSRKGYGPLGDPAQRAKPCTVSRCAHNATIVLAAGVAALALPRARHYRQEKAV